MGLDELDPSMLIAFLLQDVSDWHDLEDLHDRTVETGFPIFSIAGASAASEHPPVLGDLDFDLSLSDEDE